jgi:L-lactate dehydrogenase complex protein LldE
MEVSLFMPCAVDIVLTEVGIAVVDILRYLGCRLVYHEEQTCCGQPAFTAGQLDAARLAAQHFIEIFEKDEYIVCPSGSCVSTVKHDYPRVLAGDQRWHTRAQMVAGHIYELSQFIVDVMGVEDLGAEYGGKAAYHHSCHLLRKLGVDTQPQRLLQQVKGIELVPLPGASQCCGFGGPFALKYASLSESLVKSKVQNFASSQADVLVVSEPGCLLNISGYAHRHYPGLQVKHLACFLAQNMKGGEAHAGTAG